MFEQSVRSWRLPGPRENTHKGRPPLPRLCFRTTHPGPGVPPSYTSTAVTTLETMLLLAEYARIDPADLVPWEDDDGR